MNEYNRVDNRWMIGPEKIHEKRLQLRRLPDRARYVGQKWREIRKGLLG
jgi:hypothetical protein